MHIKLGHLTVLCASAVAAVWRLEHPVTRSSTCSLAALVATGAFALALWHGLHSDEEVFAWQPSWTAMPPAQNWSPTPAPQPAWPSGDNS